MKNVLIIGCGFGGSAALSALSRHRKDVAVTVIDRKKRFDFLPMLPDVIGGRIDPDFLTHPIEGSKRHYDFNFINGEVASLDLGKKEAAAGGEIFKYDYLVIASGSETNFYRNEEIKRYAYKLDDADDSRSILDVLGKKVLDSYLIAGGGYTGVEVATNLRIYLNRKGMKGRIAIVEKAPSILGPLPEWIKSYVRDNMSKLEIDIFTNSSIDKIENSKISVAGRGIFDNSMLIWAAGVKTADFIQNLSVEKTPQGRLKVDKYLRIDSNAFAVGDAAYFAHEGGFLRMAVQFAIMEGRCAAHNIINSIRGEGLIEYRPLDLGYIIPMANSRSCGEVLSVKTRGRLATALHYIMCVYRSYGLKNKLGIIKNLNRGGAL